MPRELQKNDEVSLLDVLDAVLEKGVVLRGDIMISIADIDLVYLDLRILLTSVETLIESTEKSALEREEAEKAEELSETGGEK
ncbi:gas vesicle protein [Alkalicoccus saliphilus]|jgi:gas vesicle structural protein|uniref:Gas vesicle protein n=1 Tax=Alkalicoccus saliphilus TaxID=200989 RepID=A0A2T4U7F1_9BACI|nr:gas vesicle protein [Alkalicoccus saliphilus]PTL39314.1 gas vesicle protein [Alkalicoccus saliphilus]